MYNLLEHCRHINLLSTCFKICHVVKERECGSEGGGVNIIEYFLRT